jgi:hypothetical protein
MSTPDDRLPHGYRNLTRRLPDGAAIEKTYTGSDAGTRLRREELCLRLLVDVLPVPSIMAKDEKRCAVLLGNITGTPGPDLIEVGRAHQALTAAGELLARLQTDASPVLMPRLDGIGIVAVHGDYGLHNLLFDSTGRQVTGLVDWESAHRGDVVEDLAWAEWIIRMHYPVAIDALDGLFTGYGAQPLWTARHGAMVTQCEKVRELCEREGEPDTIAIWRARLRTTESWTE